MSLAYTPSKILFMIFSLTERVIYSMIYWKYTNKDKQREYLTTGKFSTLFTNVIPYGVLNFLIAFSFFVFYTQKFSWGKTDNALFYSGLMMSGFSCFLALYKGLELFFNSPRSTNLNAIIFADVFCFLGLSLMNYSYGTYLSLLIPFLNYFALRKSLGRSLSTKENDFLPVRDIVLPANVG